MLNDRIFDNTNMLHIELLRFCFRPLLQSDLINSKNEWNLHRIRRQAGLKIPCGIPNLIFHWPERFGGEDCRKDLDKNDVMYLLDSQYVQTPILFSHSTERLVNELIPEVRIPNTIEEAFNLFVLLLQLVDELDDNE